MHRMQSMTWYVARMFYYKPSSGWSRQLDQFRLSFGKIQLEFFHKRYCSKLWLNIITRRGSIPTHPGPSNGLLD